jgi:hypothetical protein
MMRCQYPDVRSCTLKFPNEDVKRGVRSPSAADPINFDSGALISPSHRGPSDANGSHSVLALPRPLRGRAAHWSAHLSTHRTARGRATRIVFEVGRHD